MNADSVFMRYPCIGADGKPLTGLEAVAKSWELMIKASAEVSERLPYPHSLAPEKVIYPFILISKARFFCLLYSIHSSIVFLPFSIFS